PRTCHVGHGEPASVPDGPCHPGGLLRAGRLQRGNGLADGRQHVVLPRPGPTHFAAGLYLAGDRDGARAGSRTAGRVAGATTDSQTGGTMSKLGSAAAVGVGVLALVCTGGGERSPEARAAAPGAGGPAATRAEAAVGQGGSITGTIRFTGAKPAMPAIDMSEEAKCKAKYTAMPHEETVMVNA